MRAEVDARKADQTCQRAEQREQSGSERRTGHRRVDQVEQKPIERHISCDVARGKTSGGGMRVDLDQVRRRTGAADGEFDRVGQEPDRPQA